MTKKYQNKYRIASARMKNYDYSSNGVYFVTIVTKKREHFFGNIVNGKMVLNEIGKIVKKYWDEIPQHFLFIKLDEMVIMPNHIHGILWIDNDDTVGGRDVACNASTGEMEKTKNKQMVKISPKYGSLASVIRSFKSVVTKNSRELDKTKNVFAWQPRFHDRIIRNENELNRIREYIVKNPEMWMRDRNNGDLWI
jgi:REP element-mobilizing transposase RayT